MNNSMTSFNSNEPYLEVIVGPMYSCKTSRLVEIYKKCKFCNIRVEVINHSSDNRYDDIMLSTHDKTMIPCIQTDKLFNVWNCSGQILLDEHNEEIPRFKDILSLASCEVVLINEGQFFEDLYDFVVELLKHKKQVYVCGLDGDFERKKFGQMLDLIPICDNVIKLNALCSICKNGKKAIFSMRISKETIQTLVGSDNYIPVCRDCYENHHLVK